LAPGTIAPLGSVTIPLTPPLPAWAIAAALAHKKRIKTKRNLHTAVVLALAIFMAAPYSLLTFKRLNIRNANVGANISRVKRKN
jgi:hypothetical protein